MILTQKGARVWTDTQTFAAAIVAPGQEGTTADVVLAVSTGGSDSVTSDRPARLTGGDYSSAPFATIQAAINSLPKIIRHKVFIDVAAGSYGAFRVDGFVGGQEALYSNQAFRDGIMIRGSTALATLATGTASGTATGGTGGSGQELSSDLQDSTQAWTVNDLRRHFMKIVSGPGSVPNGPNIQRTFFDQVPMHVIHTNTATDAFALGLVGDPANPVGQGAAVPTLYEIVDLTSVITANNPSLTEQAACVIENNSCLVVVYGMKFAHASPLAGTQGASTFSHVRAANNAGRVRMLSCDFRGLGTVAGFLADACAHARITDSQFISNLGFVFNNGGKGDTSFCLLDSNGAQSTFFSMLTATVTNCKSETPTAGGGFQFQRCQSPTMQGNSACNGGTGNALTAASNERMTITSFTGTGISGFGISLVDSGHYNLSSSTTATGTSGDISLDGTALTYAQKAANIRTIKDQILARHS